MNLPWPRSLFARLMLIWLLGITAVLAVSFMLFVGERERVGRVALLESVAQELAAAVEVLDRMPAVERERWIEDLGRRRLRLSLEPLAGRLRPLPDDHELLAALRTAMPGRPIRLYLHRRGDMPHPVLVATVDLADGTALQVRLPGLLPPRGIPKPPADRLFAALFALIGGVSLLTWIAVRLATRPLSRMAAAARALGEDPERPPLPVTGPDEVAQAAAAFNQMQQRIGEHVAERTRILSAISHDLQTPITRLRLRAEMVDDDNLRARIQSDLDAMQALVKEGLDYARSLGRQATAQPIDLNGLASALRDDAADMGFTVALSGHAAHPFRGQPVALRRALWNLIENGLKFGQRVELTLAEQPDCFTVHIRDDGPGLPEDELEKVFEPFYRTEASRSRDTGGTGLGLAIARNLLRGQGGKVGLRNHPHGGLEAVVTLPRA
jgi:protein-histidine pros-kinase